MAPESGSASLAPRSAVSSLTVNLGKPPSLGKPQFSQLESRDNTYWDVIRTKERTHINCFILCMIHTSQ